MDRRLILLNKNADPRSAFFYTLESENNKNLIRDMWKNIRISILLLILVWAGITTWQDYHPNWQRPIFVLLHPINADGYSQTTDYIQQLSMKEYVELAPYLNSMSKQYRVPVYAYFQLGRELKDLPPLLPKQSNWFTSIFWSLKFRFYAWRQHQAIDGSPTVTLYLNYQQGQVSQALAHSTALQKGHIGVVNLFASAEQREQNQIVILHELLHAFGASDKYDFATGQPIYPIGYAAPEQRPLYPQQQAEIMAGRVALSQHHSQMPHHLNATVIQRKTAQELGWFKD